MKHHFITWIAAFLVSVDDANVRADTYQLTGSTVLVGGASLAGPLKLAARALTSNQAPSHGGGYTLQPGPSIILAVVPPDGSTNSPPILSLQIVGASVELSWPSFPAPPPPTFVLEESHLPSGGSWTAVVAPVDHSGGANRVRVPTPASNRFYRLRKSP